MVTILDQLPYYFSASAFVLGALSIFLSVRALSLKKNISTMSSEMEKKPVLVLIEELEKEKLYVSDKIQHGDGVFSKLLDAYAKAEVQVNQIKAGLPPPSFKIDDDESLKHAIQEIRSKQYELINSQVATNSMTSWEWFGSKSDGLKLIKIYNGII